MEFWIAQLIALVICAISAVGYFRKSKADFLFFQILASVLYGVQYALLGLFSGVVCNLITIIKYISFRNDANNDRKTTHLKSIIFCALSVIFGLFAIDSWYSFIPIVNAVMLTFATAQDNPYVLRFSYVLSNVMWIVFNFMGRAYVSTVYCFVELVVLTVSLTILSKDRNTDTVQSEEE